jgi:RNA recognition motif-containing protein
MLQLQEASSVFPTRAVKKNSKAGFVVISESSLFVKRFPKSWDEEKIVEQFGLYGVIHTIYLPRDDAGVSKQWALVDFSSSEEAERAKIAMHNFYIDKKSKKKNMR